MNTPISDSTEKNRILKEAQEKFDYIHWSLVNKGKPEDFQNFLDILGKLEWEIDQPDNPMQNANKISDDSSKVIKEIADLVKGVRLSSDTI